jgi:hypothetical protein
VDDDIVTRLRHWAKGAAEQEVQDVVDGLNYAADEIERLRRNTGCARNQRSTQFCAEALDAQRDVERLREQLRLANIDNFNTTAEVETLRAERDEARRVKAIAIDAIMAILELANSTAPTPANTGGGADHQIPEAL